MLDYALPYSWTIGKQKPWTNRWWKKSIETINCGLFSIRIQRAHTPGTWHWVVFSNVEQTVWYDKDKVLRRFIEFKPYDAIKGGTATSRGRARRAGLRVLARRDLWPRFIKEI